MRKEELHNALMHPENLSDEQLLELRETVARFPFFGAAQIALTRAFKARGDIRFTDQLSQAAIYTGHRAHLYNRLKSINPTLTTTIREVSEPLPVSEEPTLASLILNHESAVTEVKRVSTSNVSATPHRISNPAEQPQSESEVPVVDQPELTANNQEESTTIRLSELDTLEAQILVSAVNRFIADHSK
jgi:hypothetical protein